MTDSGFLKKNKKQTNKQTNKHFCPKNWENGQKMGKKEDF